MVAVAIAKQISSGAMIQLMGHDLTPHNVSGVAHRRGSCEFSDSAHANAFARVFFGVRHGVVERGLLPGIPIEGFIFTGGDLV